MSALQSATINLEVANANGRSGKYKIKTWGRKFVVFWESPDDAHHLGKGGDPAAVAGVEKDHGFVPKALFIDPVMAQFITHSWHITKREKLGTEPQVRALKFYLSANSRRYFGKQFKDTDFTQSKKIASNITKSKEYKDYEAESAIIMEEEDIAKCRTELEARIMKDDGDVRRFVLEERLWVGMLLQTEMRGHNVWGLLEDDVVILDINARRRNQPKHMAMRVRLTGDNREKHKDATNVFFIGCLCRNHQYCDLKCDVGVAEFYQKMKEEDDKNWVSKSRSTKKANPWPSLHYNRRPLFKDTSDKTLGNYYSRNRCTKSRITKLADNLDKRLDLSVNSGTNTSIKTKKRRKTFSCHTWRLTGTADVERKLGAKSEINADIKKRITGHTTDKLYTHYCGGAELEKQSALKLKKKIYLEEKEKELLNTAPSPSNNIPPQITNIASLPPIDITNTAPPQITNIASSPPNIASSPPNIASSPPDIASSPPNIANTNTAPPHSNITANTYVSPAQSPNIASLPQLDASFNTQNASQQSIHPPSSSHPSHPSHHPLYPAPIYRPPSQRRSVYQPPPSAYYPPPPAHFGSYGYGSHTPYHGRDRVEHYPHYGQPQAPHFPRYGNDQQRRQPHHDDSTVIQRLIRKEMGRMDYNGYHGSNYNGRFYGPY